MNANICMQSFALQKISYHLLPKSFRHKEPLLLPPLAPCFAIISTFPLSSSFTWKWLHFFLRYGDHGMELNSKHVCACVCMCVCVTFITSKIYKVHKLDFFLISLFIYVMATCALILLFFIFTMLKITGFDWNYIEFLFFATMAIFFLGI